MYRIIVPPKVVKEISGIDKRYRRAISAKIDNLSVDPLSGKKLDPPLAHLRSIRIGVYRVIYRVNKQHRIVYVSTAGHRSKVYRKR